MSPTSCKQPLRWTSPMYSYMRTFPLKVHYKAIKILAECEVGWYQATNVHSHKDNILTTSDESWAAAVSWEWRRSQNVQSHSFPNILLDSWEGLKACTFEKRQSKGAHFERNFRRTKCSEITSHFFRHASRGAAWPLHLKFASYAYVSGVCSWRDRNLQVFLKPVHKVKPLRYT